MEWFFLGFSIDTRVFSPTFSSTLSPKRPKHQPPNRTPHLQASPHQFATLGDDALIQTSLVATTPQRVVAMQSSSEAPKRSAGRGVASLLLKEGFWGEVGIDVLKRRRQRNKVQKRRLLSSRSYWIWKGRSRCPKQAPLHFTRIFPWPIGLDLETTKTPNARGISSHHKDARIASHCHHTSSRASLGNAAA